MSRHERFPPSYQQHVQHLAGALTQHIVQKSSGRKPEAGNANTSLANFIKVLLEAGTANTSLANFIKVLLEAGTANTSLANFIKVFKLTRSI